MGKLIVLVAIIGGIAFAWHKGWIAQWFNTALDSSIEGTRNTQRAATKLRPADPVEEKK